MATTISPRVAARLVALYRSRHTIEPVTVDGQRVCDVCGFKVYPIKGGLRHDTAQVERMAEKAALA